MAVPQNKDELLKAIDSSFARLLKELEAVPPDLVEEPGMEGHAQGTRMSVSDLVAYLIGWNELVLKWLERDAAGQPVDFPETGFKWNELGRLAQKFYRDYRGIAFDGLLERLGAARARIVSVIESCDNDGLYGRPWYGKWTMGRMIQFNTASPYDNARGRLRTWLKAKGVPRKRQVPQAGSRKPEG
ncbi:ClbS/DfsB family four-helix bundle protein [Rhizobium puerariae]|uniref:ClbS/DfsB family four-helix bundle protein n=1 Tax=Rhizobium puerariae TaxID=1585791 RepID=A0ABV6AH10_9HYPH